MSSYDDKITQFKTKASIGNFPSQTPTRKLGSNTAMSQYRVKNATTGGSPVRILQGKNDVYDQITNSARMHATIQPQKQNDADAQSIITQAIESVRGTRGHSLIHNTAVRGSSKKID